MYDSTLWPEINPYNTFTLNKSGHEIYVEECGNPNGEPIIFLHGGPGGGCDSSHRRLFDPHKFRAILFDQRGCGRSLPNASIINNTPNDLITDIIDIRNKLQLDQFHIFGGSWGSTLALLYAIKHPTTVKSLILRGIFLGTQSEIEWIYEKDGCALFHPESYQAFTANLNEGNDVVSQYYQKLCNEDMVAAKNWAIWEAINSGINVSEQTILTFTEPKIAMSLAKISAHYFYHKLFIQPNYIIENIKPIADIPTLILQGQYDLLCPPKHAHKLAQHLNHVELNIIESSGHSLFEPKLLKRMIHKLNAM